MSLVVSLRPACPALSCLALSLRLLTPKHHSHSFSQAPLLLPTPPQPPQPTARPSCSQRASPRQSRIRSPAYRSSGGLTAQPTLASHRIADWASAACSPWSRLDQLPRQTPPAVFATLATRYSTPVLHLLGLCAAHSSRSACATRLRSLPDWLQSPGAFAPSHPRATSHCNIRLRLQHCYLAVDLSRRIYRPAREISHLTNLPLKLKSTVKPNSTPALQLTHQHLHTNYSGTQTLLPIAAGRLAKKKKSHYPACCRTIALAPALHHHQKFPTL